MVLENPVMPLTFPVHLNRRQHTHLHLPPDFPARVHGEMRVREASEKGAARVALPERRFLRLRVQSNRATIRGHETWKLHKGLQTSFLQLMRVPSVKGARTLHGVERVSLHRRAESRAPDLTNLTVICKGAPAIPRLVKWSCLRSLSHQRLPSVQLQMATASRTRATNRHRGPMRRPCRRLRRIPLVCHRAYRPPLRARNDPSRTSCTRLLTTSRWLCHYIRRGPRLLRVLLPVKPGCRRIKKSLPHLPLNAIASSLSVKALR